MLSYYGLAWEPHASLLLTFTGELSQLQERLGNGVTAVSVICCCVTNDLNTYWLKTTMDIYSFSGSGLQERPTWAVLFPCGALAEYRYAWHSCSHPGKETYTDEAGKDHRRIMTGMMKQNKGILNGHRSVKGQEHPKTIPKMNEEAEGLNKHSTEMPGRGIISLLCHRGGVALHHHR